MSDINTPIKDLTEMQRLLIGSAINFLYNILNNQINHIENHDESLMEYLTENQKAQEDYILLKSLRKVAEESTVLFGETFKDIAISEKESLAIPGFKLEHFLEDVFKLIACGHDDN